MRRQKWRLDSSVTCPECMRSCGVSAGRGDCECGLFRWAIWVSVQMLWPLLSDDQGRGRRQREGAVGLGEQVRV